jgi:hypothetical protein
MEQARKDAEKIEKDRIIDRMVNGARIQVEGPTNSLDSQILLDLQSAIEKKVSQICETQSRRTIV